MGSGVTDYKEQKSRLDKCTSCEFYIPKKNILPARCDKCGCVLIIKTKFLNQHCPLDPPKW